MQKTVFSILLLLIPLFATAPQKPDFPLPPDTGTLTASSTVEEVSVPVAPDLPSRLVIPAIKLNDNILKVGTNEKGEMDVPDGSSKDVGWYQFGTVPGDVGSAVIDAHVFAAFAKLRYVSVGSNIYIETVGGKRLHFVVTEMKVYALKEVPADLLFNRDDKARLNLITCAGKLTPDHSTYDHRLVVYAELAE